MKASGRRRKDLLTCSGFRFNQRKLRHGCCWGFALDGALDGIVVLCLLYGPLWVLILNENWSACLHDMVELVPAFRSLADAIAALLHFAGLSRRVRAKRNPSVKAL